MTSVLYVERRPSEFVSLEKAFRTIARNLPDRFSHEFQQVPFSSRVHDSLRNIIFFRPHHADIFHITGHVNYMALSSLPQKRTVLSIMDTRFVHLHSGVRRWLLKKLFLDIPVHRLQYITAISEAVKNEIVEQTGCAEEKIRVLGLPVLEHLTEGEMRPFNKEKPVILQIGTMANKNLSGLASALEGLDCELWVIGKPTEGQRQILQKCKIDHRFEWELSDSEVRKRYQDCDVVAFCSTYEGFGLPIIEAQAMRKPVITSNISPMRETAAGGAMLVDPFSTSSIRAGLVKLIEDDSVRNDLIDKGIANVKQFAPHDIAGKYAALYDEMLAAM